MTAARRVDWTPEQYHAESRRISSSMIREFLRSPHAYHARHVAHTIAPREATPAMLLGSIVDEMLFPTRPLPRYVTAPKVDRRTTAGKAEWAAFAASVEAAGQTPAPADTMATATAMADAVRSHPIAQTLLGMGGRAQGAIIWDDEQTGLPCRALPDLVIDEMRLVVDLKTTTDPRPDAWSRKLAEYSYHGQMAWYCEAARLLTGEPHTAAHIVVASIEPYEVAVYDLAPSAVEMGASSNRDALVELEKSIRLDSWRAQWEREATIIDLPPWYRG